MPPASPGGFTAPAVTFTSRVAKTAAEFDQVTYKQALVTVLSPGASGLTPAHIALLITTVTDRRRALFAASLSFTTSAFLAVSDRACPFHSLP